MSAINTDYMLRVPSADELLRAFGSAAKAMRATGAEIRLACFYIANPERAKDAPDVSMVSDSPLIPALEAAITQEIIQIEADLPPPKRKRPIAEIMRRTGLSRARVKRAIAEKE